MHRTQAGNITREELNKHGLTDWGVRITADPTQSFLGLCVYKDKVIIINAHHCDLHNDSSIINTIRHEVAHALTPGHGHDEVWAAKAKEVGCDNTMPCSTLSLPDHVIDAIRSGQMVEVVIEEETQVIRRPKYVVTRLQDKCPICGKVAKEKSSFEYPDKVTGNTIKLITLECFHVIQKVIPRGTPYETLVTNWWKDEVKNCKHEWIKTRCSNCGEFKLMDFQITGARLIEAALAQGKGAGVFDEMGLGKTIQALAYLHFSKKRTLYIVKSAIKFQWFKEIMRVLGPEAFAQIINTSRDYVFPNLRSYIISYDLLRRFDREKIQKLGIEVVVLDECQQIKNPDSTRTQEVRKIVGGGNVKVIALSGTPWQNRGAEFFPVLNMMDPIKFHSYQHFIQTWVNFYWHGDKQKMGGIKNIPRFKEYIKNFVIRREYNEVMDEFPDVNRMKLNMQMDDMAQTTYDDATSDFVKWYNQHVIDGTEDTINGMDLIAQLQHLRHLVAVAKVPATLGFMEEFYEENDRSMVIFVHHRDVARLLLDGLRERFKDVNVESLSADHSDAERYEIAQRYGVKRTFLIASTLACGEGIDGLQKGYDSILHERQWNPAKEDQATPGRFKRIGQKSPVINITLVHADGTIDTFLDEIVETKRIEFHKAMNKEGSKVEGWVENDIVRQLARKIVENHNKKRGAQGKKVELTKIAPTPIAGR